MSDAKPEDVIETMCVEGDGRTRPMRKVLAERASNVRQRPAAERAAAARVRGGLIGDLHACSCSWPLVIADTLTGHEEWCTAHVWQTRAPTWQPGTPGLATVHFVRPPAPARRGGARAAAPPIARALAVAGDEPPDVLVEDLDEVTPARPCPECGRRNYHLVTCSLGARRGDAGVDVELLGAPARAATSTPASALDRWDSEGGSRG